MSLSEKRCTVRESFACWQYTSNAADMPMWLVPHVSFEERKGKEVLSLHQAGDDWTVEVGDWLVRMPDGHISPWSEDEFRKSFDINPAALCAGTIDRDIVCVGLAGHSGPHVTAEGLEIV